MPVKFNSEFNYRFQVIGETPWEKIKTLKGFLEGRRRVLDCIPASKKRYQALLSKIAWLKKTMAPEHEILELEASLIEAESGMKIEEEAFELTRQEVDILEKLLKELYDIVEPTRLPGYTDEQMFEYNAANEFTVMIGREIHSEILAHGHPSPAKLKNAMSNPVTWEALKRIGLIPKDAFVLENNDPRAIEFNLPLIDNKETPCQITSK